MQHFCFNLVYPEAAVKKRGIFPHHGTPGYGHIAFLIIENELQDWKEHLKRYNSEIEKEVEWTGWYKFDLFQRSCRKHHRINTINFVE